MPVYASFFLMTLSPAGSRPIPTHFGSGSATPFVIEFAVVQCGAGGPFITLTCDVILIRILSVLIFSVLISSYTC